MISIYKVSPPILFLKNVIFKHSFKKNLLQKFSNKQFENISITQYFANLVSSSQDMLKPENLDIISFLCCYLCAQCVSKQPYPEASVLLLHACSVGFDFSQPCCPCGSPGKSPGVGCISYSRGSSWPRARTHISRVSCIGRRILYCSATWEALSVDNFS